MAKMLKGLIVGFSGGVGLLGIYELDI